MLSKKAQLLKPSPTLALSAKAKELASQGKPVLNLTVGEPDWPSFEVAKQAAKEAIDRDETKYTLATGLPQLKSAIVQWTQAQTQIAYRPAEVAVTTGAKFALYSLFQMILDPGDEVLIPAPYWVSYPTIVELAGGVSRVITTDESSSLKLTPELLRSQINPKTKALLLNSPSNPTGATYTKDELKALSQVCLEYPQLLIVFDDIYNALYFASDSEKNSASDFFAPHLLQACPELKDRCFIINGASKAFAMTGWRIGWILGPEPVIKAVGNHISQSTSNPCSISQWAALAALEQGAQDLRRCKQMLQARKEMCLEAFDGLKYFQVFPPQGAFYLWVGLKKVLGQSFEGHKLTNSTAVSQILLEKFFLATVPGLEFGVEGYLRLSFAASDEELSEAFRRLAQFESGLSQGA